MALTKVDDRGLKTPIDLLDNEKIRLGTGNDLELFHDGNNSRIEDTGTGYLAIRSNNIRFENAAANEALLYITENGAVELYHDNTKRFETFSSGAVVTGLLGIGTSSPDRTIHCHNSSNTTNVRTKFSNGTTGEGASDGFEIGINASDPAQAVLVNYENSPMAFFTNASERLRIDESGVVRIGGTDSYNASDKLTLVGSGNTSLTIDSTSTTESSIFFADGATGTEAYRGYLQYKNADDALAIGTAATERMRLDSSGRLLIGTTAAGEGSADNLTVADSSHCGITIRSGSSSGGNVFFTDLTSGDQFQGYVQYNHSDDTLKFGTNKVERLRLSSKGAINSLFNDGDSVGVLHKRVQGSNSHNFFEIRSSGSTTTSGGTLQFAIETDGDVKNTNNSYGSLSDIKLKENIVDAKSQWDDIKALKIRNYNFKSELDLGTYTQIGLIAQEVEETSSGLVVDNIDRDDEGNDLGTITKTLRYSVLHIKALKALQEAMAKIEVLETKVAALEGS